VTNWIKDTSATGYLRSTVNPNARRQDGFRTKLLCSQCEQRFSVLEKIFAETIFNRYVGEDLNDIADRPRKFRIEYDEWLLRFVVSVQWRIVAATRNDQELDQIATIQDKLQIDKAANTWRQYLLGSRADAGDCDHHLLFLQSMSGISGSLPSYIDDRIDVYLLRATDGTIVAGPSHVGVYSKLGPIVLYTSIYPKKLPNMRHSRIRRNGAFASIRPPLNADIAKFIYIDRVRLALKLAELSNKQVEKILQTMKENPTRVVKSQTAMVVHASSIIKQKKRNGTTPNA
jgi:hypothetical protein